MTSEQFSDQKILSLWKNPLIPFSYRGIRSFRVGLKTYFDQDIPSSRLLKILSQDPTFITHQRRNKKILRRTYYLKYYGELCQADLAYMFSYNDYKYIILFIDCYSNKIFTKPLKSKDSAEVKNALEQFFKELKTPIHVFETDRFVVFN